MVELDVIALVKERERYIFTCDQDPLSRDALLQTFGRFAAEKDLSFTWYDAAMLSQKLRHRIQRELDERRSADL